MFRDLLSSRLTQIVLAFCVITVGGSLLFSWSVRRTTESEPVRDDRLLHGNPEKQNERDPAQVQNVQNTTDTTRTPVETTRKQHTNITRRTQAPANKPNSSEMTDVIDVSRKDGASAKNKAVSPFGFGPYPELPEGWPADKIWPCISADHELMARVMVELAHQGITTKGSIMENGYVYPTYPDTVYIKWAYKEKNGALYIADMSGDEDAVDRISALEEARRCLPKNRYSRKYKSALF